MAARPSPISTPTTTDTCTQQTTSGACVCGWVRCPRHDYGAGPPADLQRAMGRGHDVGVLNVMGGRMRQLDEFLDPKLGGHPRGKRHLMPECCDDGVCAGGRAVPPSQQACDGVLRGPCFLPGKPENVPKNGTKHQRSGNFWPGHSGRRPPSLSAPRCRAPPPLSSSSGTESLPAPPKDASFSSLFCFPFLSPCSFCFC